MQENVLHLFCLPICRRVCRIVGYFFWVKTPTWKPSLDAAFCFLLVVLSCYRSKAGVCTGVRKYIVSALVQTRAHDNIANLADIAL